MMILDPIPVVIENLPADHLEEISIPFKPNDTKLGTHLVPFTRTVFIDRLDFREEDSEDYFRLAPGKSVGLLKVPFTIRATSYTKGPDGNVAAPRTRTTLSPHREPFITLDSASFFVLPAPPY